jgi:hypothetical protein
MDQLHEPRIGGNCLYDGSWPAIVELIFDVIAHRDRLALKRKALGRHKRKLVRRRTITNPTVRGVRQ